MGQTGADVRVIDRFSTLRHEASREARQGRWPRRSVLKFLSVAGAGAVFGRALVSLAAERTQVSAEMIRQAEWVAGVSTDAAFAFEALPHIPMMLTFYDADEEFPAEAKLFYDARALDFLDLECLAVLGMILAAELERVSQD